MSLFIDIPSDPIAAFDGWLQEAAKSEPNDPNAMALATVGADGLPNARMVLLKGHDARGFVFYTNLESQKGNELEQNAKAALVFHWKSLHRQVRIQGPISPVSDEEADAYYQSRGRESIDRGIVGAIESDGIMLAQRGESPLALAKRVDGTVDDVRV